MKKCNQCGACCVVIPISQTKKELTNKGDGAFIKKHWKRISRKKGYERLNAYLGKNFNRHLGTLKEFNKSFKNKITYACDWFNEETGKCRHYNKRPRVCKDYPYYKDPIGSNVNHKIITHICGYYQK